VAELAVNVQPLNVPPDAPPPEPQAELLAMTHFITWAFVESLRIPLPITL